MYMSDTQTQIKGFKMKEILGLGDFKDINKIVIYKYRNDVRGYIEKKNGNVLTRSKTFKIDTITTQEHTLTYKYFVTYEKEDQEIGIFGTNEIKEEFIELLSKRIYN